MSTAVGSAIGVTVGNDSGVGASVGWDVGGVMVGTGVGSSLPQAVRAKESRSASNRAQIGEVLFIIRSILHFFVPFIQSNRDRNRSS